MDHIGIDVYKKHSQICILSEAGELIERRVRTEAEQFAEVLGPRPRAHIVVESATESEWVARCLEGLGHQVIVADPNFAPMYAQRSRKVKTDRRDARASPRPRSWAPTGPPIVCPMPSGTSGADSPCATPSCAPGRGTSP